MCYRGAVEHGRATASVWLRTNATRATDWRVRCQFLLNSSFARLSTRTVAGARTTFQSRCMSPHLRVHHRISLPSPTLSSKPAPSVTRPSQYCRNKGDVLGVLQHPVLAGPQSMGIENFRAPYITETCTIPKLLQQPSSKRNITCLCH